MIDWTQKEEIDKLKREIEDLSHQNAELKRQLEGKEKEAGMDAPEAIKCLQNLKAALTIEGIYNTSKEKLVLSIDSAVEALRNMEDFERAQILIGGRLNGRTYAYKCGLEDGMRKKVENIMNQAAKSFREYEKAKEECKKHAENVKPLAATKEKAPEKAELLPINNSAAKCELLCMRCSKCHRVTAIADYCQWCGTKINYESH